MTDAKNFEDLIKQYHPMIYKICRVYSSQSDFDDLYQEMLINIWKSLKSFEGRSKLSTWLYRVVLNTALTYRRNTNKSNIKIPIDQIPDVIEETSQVPDQERKINRLYDTISQLKKNDRSIVLLYLDEKTYDEISEITGLSVSNVGVKINRLKKKLFQILNTAENE